MAWRWSFHHRSKWRPDVTSVGSRSSKKANRSSSSSRLPRRTRASRSATSSANRTVVSSEVVTGRPVPRHQCVADEHLAGAGGVDPVETDPAVVDDRQPVQRHRLTAHGAGRAGVPPRLAVRVLHEVRGQLLGPRRLDRGDPAGEQSRRLDQLGRHHPRRRLLGQPRAGRDHERRPPSPRGSPADRRHASPGGTAARPARPGGRDRDARLRSLV